MQPRDRNRTYSGSIPALYLFHSLNLGEKTECYATCLSDYRQVKGFCLSGLHFFYFSTFCPRHIRSKTQFLVILLFGNKDTWKGQYGEESVYKTLSMSPSNRSKHSPSRPSAKLSHFQFQYHSFSIFQTKQAFFVHKYQSQANMHLSQPFLAAAVLILGISAAPSAPLEARQFPGWISPGVYRIINKKGGNAIDLWQGGNELYGWPM